MEELLVLEGDSWSPDALSRVRELVIKRDHPTNTLSGQHLRDLGILLLIYETIYLLPSSTTTSLMLSIF